MTAKTSCPAPAPGEPDKAYVNMSDLQLAQYIAQHIGTYYLREGIGRAVHELDRRLNRS